MTIELGCRVFVSVEELAKDPNKPHDVARDFFALFSDDHGLTLVGTQSYRRYPKEDQPSDKPLVYEYWYTQEAVLETPCLCGGNGRDCDCSSALP